MGSQRQEDQKAHRRHRGRSVSRPAFDPTQYKDRNSVERCIGKLKQYRAVAARFHKRQLIYQAPTSPRSGSGYGRPSHDPRDRP